MSEVIKELPEDLTESIEDIRQANHAIRACIRLLHEDSVNQGCQAEGPVPFIRFDIETQVGLMMAIDACSKSISRHIDSLEMEKDYPIGWIGSDRPDEWKARSYPPRRDEYFARRIDQAIARGERDPLEAAMQEAWAEHDQKQNAEKINDDMPDEETTIQ